MIDQWPRIISAVPSCCGDSNCDIEFLCQKLTFRATKARIEATDFCEGYTSERGIGSLNNTWKDEAVRSNGDARDRLLYCHATVSLIVEKNATTYESEIWSFDKAFDDRVEEIVGRVAIVIAICDNLSPC